MLLLPPDLEEPGLWWSADCVQRAGGPRDVSLEAPAWPVLPAALAILPRSRCAPPHPLQATKSSMWPAAGHARRVRPACMLDWQQGLHQIACCHVSPESRVCRMGPPCDQHTPWRPQGWRWVRTWRSSCLLTSIMIITPQVRAVVCISTFGTRPVHAQHHRLQHPSLRPLAPASLPPAAPALPAVGYTLRVQPRPDFENANSQEYLEELRWETYVLMFNHVVIWCRCNARPREPVRAQPSCAWLVGLAPSQPMGFPSTLP